MAKRLSPDARALIRAMKAANPESPHLIAWPARLKPQPFLFKYLPPDWTAERAWEAAYELQKAELLSIRTSVMEGFSTEILQLRPKAQKPRRKPQTDVQRDAKWARAWHSGRYKTYACCASELRITERSLKLALDRHRKRRKQ